VTDSERFYSSILDLFEDADEQEDVNVLLVWWNRFVSALLLSILGTHQGTQSDIPNVFFSQASCPRKQRIC
jgi:hypothetical protein